MRRDKLGRRIGRNWWREYVTDLWRCADQAWWLAREAACNGWATEEREWTESHPRPLFRDFLTSEARYERIAA